MKVYNKEYHYNSSRVGVLLFSNKKIKEILYSINFLKKIDFLFFKRLAMINLFPNSNKNYFTLRGLDTVFLFGEVLSMEKLIKAIILTQSLGTKPMFNRIDLRFSDIIVSY